MSGFKRVPLVPVPAHRAAQGLASALKRNFKMGRVFAPLFDECSTGRDDWIVLAAVWLVRLGCASTPNRLDPVWRFRSMMVVRWGGISTGREDRIRTCDPHTPSVMRYQAALLPETSGRRRYKRALFGWQASNDARGKVSPPMAPPAKVVCDMQRFARCRLPRPCIAATRAHLPILRGGVARRCLRTIHVLNRF